MRKGKDKRKSMSDKEVMEAINAAEKAESRKSMSPDEVVGALKAAEKAEAKAEEQAGHIVNRRGSVGEKKGGAEWTWPKNPKEKVDARKSMSPDEVVGAINAAEKAGARKSMSPAEVVRALKAAEKAEAKAEEQAGHIVNRRGSVGQKEGGAEWTWPKNVKKTEMPLDAQTPDQSKAAASDSGADVKRHGRVASILKEHESKTKSVPEDDENQSSKLNKG